MAADSHIDERYRALTRDELAALAKNGCTAEDFGLIRVADGFDATRVRNVHFVGTNEIGRLDESVPLAGDMKLPAGIRNATLCNCHLGDNVYIHNVGRAISNYDIGDGAVIANTDLLAVEPGCTFGNGVEVEAVNEKGGREVRIFNELSSQVAYLSAVYRHRPAFTSRLDALVQAYVDEKRSDRGWVGPGAEVQGCGEILGVNIGPKAVVKGVSFLRNGTILSDSRKPTLVANGVQAEHFIIGKWSKVTEGVVAKNVFVGEGVRLGRQFSAENSLFFANCEGFHGEAVALMAGPYTVTHHKSTLLIAGTFSFYNAGSGTNQSNHMYKLGPVHQGLLERGCKTGSFAYLLWPSRVGAFSVVMDKHGTSLDLGDMPFSYVTVEGGRSTLTPAMNMMTVAMARDEAKWRDRDRRGEGGLDMVHVDTFSPYTVGKMIAGRERLLKASESGKEEINMGGAWIKRVLCKKQARAYETGIKKYLYTKVLEALERSLPSGADWRAGLAPAPEAVLDRVWVDVGGMLAPRCRIDQILAAVESGAIDSVQALRRRLEALHAAKEADEWAWARAAFEQTEGKSIDEISASDLVDLLEDLRKRASKFTNVLAKDAGKEYGDSSKLGFAADHPHQVDADFAAVRGTLEDDGFVKGLHEAQAALEARIDAVVPGLKA